MSAVPDKLTQDRHAQVLKMVVDAGISLAYSQKGAGIAAVWAEMYRPHIKVVSGPDAPVPTWAVTREAVYINADWTLGTSIGEKPMTVQEIAFLVYHETMHGALAHRHSDDRDLNIAQDAIINHVGVADGIGQFPGGKRRGVLLSDYQAKGYTGPVDSEELYRWMKAQKQQGKDPHEGQQGQGQQGQGQGQQGNQPGQPGQPGKQGNQPGQGQGQQGQGPGSGDRTVGRGCAPKGQPTKGEGDAEGDARANDRAKIAAEKARVTIREVAQKAGEGTAMASLLAPRETKCSIRSMVRRVFERASETARTRTVNTYSRASRRGGVDPTVIRPGKTGTEATVAFIGDVSGSLGDEGARLLIGMIDSVAKDFPEVEVYLVTHTDKVVWEGKLGRGGDAEKAKEAVAFTGGTRFAPAYDAVRARGRFDVGVHFTDGYNSGEWPEKCAKELFIALFGNGNGMTTPPEGARIVPVEPVR